MLNDDETSVFVESDGLLFSDEELDALLNRSELYKEMAEINK